MIRVFQAALPALLLAASLVAAPMLALRPVPGAPLLAWFPPGTDAPLAAASGGGLPVAPGPFGSVLVRGEPDLASRLVAAGAWLVLRADALGGCFLPLPTERTLP